jgi:hypothetical protein
MDGYLDAPLPHHAATGVGSGIWVTQGGRTGGDS